MSSSRAILIVTLAPAVWLASCGGHAPETKKADAGPPVAVKTAAVEETTLPEMYEATGTVRAKVTSVLSARVMGYLKDVRVQVGDTVRAGQVVATIDAREIENGLRQAEAARTEARSGLPEAMNGIAAAKAQLDLAEATFNRMKSLFDQKSITNQEFDEASARHRMAKANHEMAQAKKTQLEARIAQADQAVATAEVQRGYLAVAAPFGGIVVERRAEPGMLAAPGAPIVVIEQSGAYRLEAGVEEARLSKVKPGTPVSVRLDALDRDIQARVSEIVPALDPMSRTFMARIDLPGIPNLRTGLFGRARFQFGEKHALSAPSDALVQDGQVQRVFVADGGTARARLITTGSRGAARVEVLSGLRAGERVVAPVPFGLADGSKIEVRP
jgi:RND family efflux transporter MFP subunit